MADRGTNQGSSDRLAKRWMANGPPHPLWTFFVGLYLVVLGCTSSWLMVALFPYERTTVTAVVPGGEIITSLPAAESRAALASEASAGVGWRTLNTLEFEPVHVGSRVLIPKLRVEQGLIVLALLAGVLGSFMHSAQSFAAYVGNRTVRRSWILWYFVRPPIGAILGMMFYFVVRAGFVTANADAVSPYGVVAFAGLAGWFSKQATEKLADVFETLFDARDRAESYRDKLGDSSERPRVTKIAAADRAADVDDLVLIISGDNFARGAEVTVGNHTLLGQFVSESEMTVTIPADKIPTGPGPLELTVRNPGPTSIASEPMRFELPVVGVLEMS